MKNVEITLNLKKYKKTLSKRTLYTCLQQEIWEKIAAKERNLIIDRRKKSNLIHLSLDDLVVS